MSELTEIAIRSISLPDLCQEYELTKIIKGLSVSKSNVKKKRLGTMETNGETERWTRYFEFLDDMTSTEEDVSYPNNNLDYQAFPSAHT